MRKICFMSRTNHSDSTSIPLQVAAGLARIGKRVLFVDLHSSTKRQLYQQQLRQKNMYHYVVDQEAFSKCITTLGKNLDVMGSQGFHNEAELLAFEDLNSRLLFKKMFRTIPSYDYVLLDCGSKLDLLTQNALFYAPEVIIESPTSIEGIDYTMKIIRSITRFSRLYDNKVRISRILPIEYTPKQKESRSALAMLYSEYTGRIVAQPINKSRALKKAQQEGTSVFQQPSSSTTDQFRNVVEMIVQDEQLYDDTKKEWMRKQAQMMHFSREPRAEVPLEKFQEEELIEQPNRTTIRGDE